MNQEGPRTRGIARIYEQRSIARGYREITLSYALGYQGPINPQPGQFFTILPHRYPLTMMRRPFAYSASSNKGFSFIYEIRGTNTAELADLEEGCQVDWIGPLGSHFSHSGLDSLPVLIAGGIGVGPIYYFAQKLAEEGKKLLVILGARKAELIPHLDWPENVELRICTDDGSMGIHGSVMDGLENIDFENAEFFTCGPRPMMMAIHQLAKLHGSPCQVSMEEMMACGVGACQGCAVQVVDSNDLSRQMFKRVCVEGPIFESREIVW